MLDVLERSDGTATSVAMHDAGVQCEHPIAIGITAMPYGRVAQIPLRPSRAGLDSIECRSATCQHRPRRIIGADAKVPGRYHSAAGYTAGNGAARHVDAR